MKRFLPIFCMALSLLLASPALGAQDRDESEALREVCAQAAACVLTPDMTDGEKALALHDWLALRCAYNPLDEASRDTAAGSLIKGLAVCRGYAAGYAYLTWSAGLSGLSTYSAQLDHAWVILALDGSRYFSGNRCRYIHTEVIPTNRKNGSKGIRYL